MWHLRCFGALKAEGTEQVIERFRTQKTAALLALLALRGTQSRESLCAILWPDAAPEAARNSLSAALSALRRDLGDGLLVADRQNVSLAPGTVTIDVAAFDATLKNKDFARAVELYAGHLLAGFHEDPFPALAGEYEEKARGAFCARIEELEKAAQPDALRSLARRAIALFSDDECWFLALMRAHYFAGDLEAALRTYDALLRHARKIGEVASEDARQLAKLLRREKEQKEQTLSSEVPLRPVVAAPAMSLPLVPEAPPTPSAPLPSQWTRFFGREAERELLRDWLGRGERLITLSGAGGAGKTRLAIETLDLESKPAEMQRPGPVHFVPLAALTDASLLASSVRDALGLTVTTDLSPQEQIARALNGTRSVLLLDNFEQLVPQGAAYLQSLREKLPDTTFMVTSRTLLRLPGEREFPVAPLPTPLQQMAIEDISECPSVELFCDRSGLGVNADNAEAIGALCRRLDGIPLALELAAARARLLSPAQILERLEKHPDFLQSRELGVPARHKTLRATIEWSADLLSPELRAFFTRLSVFRGGWTLEAAEAVCQEPDAIESLTLLRESSLVRVETREGETRFRMLETLREFGEDQLAPDEHATIERAFFDYYLGVAQQAAHAMRGPEQTVWLTRLDTEQDNVRAALAWARAHDAQRGLQLATALIDFWETRLSLQEGRTWIETFLRATAPEPLASTPITSEPVFPRPGRGGPEGGGGLEVRSRALSGAGRLAWYSSDLTEAGALIEQGIETARSSGDSPSLIYATRTLARVTALAGQETRSQELGSDAVQLARATNDPRLLLEALTDLAFTAVNAGDLVTSAGASEEAIALARQVADERTLCLALVTRAAAYSYQEGDHFRATYTLLDEVEKLAGQLGVQFELMTCHAIRGHMRTKQRQFDLAQSYFNRAFTICRAHYLNSWSTVNILYAISYLFFERGESQGAVRLTGGADALAEALNYSMMPFLIAENTRYRARMSAALGESDYAADWELGHEMTPTQVVGLAMGAGESTGPDELAQDELVREAVPGDGAKTPLAVRARALSGVGRLASYSQELDASRALVEQGLEAAQRSGDTASFVHAVMAFGYFSMTTGDVEGDMARACALGEEAVERSRTAADRSLLVQALFALGIARAVLGHFEDARGAAKEGIALATEMGDEQRLIRAQNLLATIALYSGDDNQARAFLEAALPLCRRCGDVWDLMVSLSLFSAVAREQGDLKLAYETIAEGLNIARQNPHFYWGGANLVATMGFVLLHLGQPEKTVVLMGAAEAIREASQTQLIPFLNTEYRRYGAAARDLVGEAAFEALWQQGRALSREAAIEFALSSKSRLDAAPDSAPSPAQNAPLDMAMLGLRAQALSGAGRLAWYANDLSQADALLAQGLESAQQADDKVAVIYATRSLARVTTLAGDVAQGRTLGREAVQLARQLDNASVLQEALTDLIFAEFNTLDFASAAEAGEEAVALARRTGDEGGLALALATLSLVYYSEGRVPIEQVSEFLAESEAICRRLILPWGLVICTSLQARIHQVAGQFEVAQAHFNEALWLCQADAPVSWNLVNVLCSVAYCFYERGHFAASVCLFGAADAMSESIGYSLLPFMVREHERTLTAAREVLGETAYRAALQRGRDLTPAETVEFARNPDLNVIRESAEEDQNEEADLLATRARALSGAGRMATYGSDLDASRALVEQGLEAARQAGDSASFVHAVAAYVSFAITTSDSNGKMTRARALSEEAVRLSREIGDRSLLLEALISRAYSEMLVGEIGGVGAQLHEAIALARALGDEQRLARASNCLTSLAFYAGDLDRASLLSEEGLALARRANSPWDLIVALWMDSCVNREQGSLWVAYASLCEALVISRENPDFRWGVSNLLLTMSYLAFRCGHAEEATTLMGATQALCEAASYQMVPLFVPEYQRFSTAIRAALQAGVFEALWRQGHHMKAEQAIDFALHLDLNTRLLVNETPASSLEADRARALSAAGRLAWHGSDFKESRALIEQGLEAARRLNDTPAFVEAVAAFVRLAMTTEADRWSLEQAGILGEEAVQRSREEGDKTLLLESFIALLYARLSAQADPGLRPIGAEALALARELGDEQRLSRILTCNASLEYHLGNIEVAQQLNTEAVAVARRINSPWDLTASLWSMSHVLRELGEVEAAYQAGLESLRVGLATYGIQWPLVNISLSLAFALIRRGQVEDGVRMLGGGTKLSEMLEYRIGPVLMADYQRYLDLAHATLDNGAFEVAWKRGLAMTPEQIVDFALSR